MATGFEGAGIYYAYNYESELWLDADNTIMESILEETIDYDQTTDLLTLTDKGKVKLEDMD